jgi:hypothetical protein
MMVFVIWDGDGKSSQLKMIRHLNLEMCQAPAITADLECLEIQDSMDEQIDVDTLEQVWELLKV